MGDRLTSIVGAILSVVQQGQCILLASRALYRTIPLLPLLVACVVLVSWHSQSFMGCRYTTTGFIIVKPICRLVDDKKVTHVLVAFSVVHGRHSSFNQCVKHALYNWCIILVELFLVSVICEYVTVMTWCSLICIMSIQIVYNGFPIAQM